MTHQPTRHSGIIMIIKHEHHEIIANEQAKRWEEEEREILRERWDDELFGMSWTNSSMQTICIYIWNAKNMLLSCKRDVDLIKR